MMMSRSVFFPPSLVTEDWYGVNTLLHKGYSRMSASITNINCIDYLELFMLVDRVETVKSINLDMGLATGG